MSTTTTTVTQTKLEAAPPVPSGDVTAKLYYMTLPEDGSVPYHYVEKAPEGTPSSNYGTEEREMTIHDIRGRESEFTVNANGFTTVKTHSSPDVDFDSDESIQKTYYPEVEQLLLDQIAGSSKVVIFDHTVRRAGPEAKRAPVLRTHLDQTGRSAGWRVPLHVEDKEEADRLLQGRFRIVNVWRPLNGTVESSPLAMADSTTVPQDDIIPTEHRYPNRTGETAGIKYNPDTRWHYLSAMGNDERILLQCFDSGEPGKGQGARVPHTAFVHPGSTPQSKPRESIEVRALVFG